MSLDAWRRWFVATAQKVIEKVPVEGVAIFFQTDIKKAGTWVDKGYLVSRAAEQAGAATLWHKIACRRPAGSVSYGRPAYAHLLCFSKGLRADAGRSTADVLPDVGEMTWTRAIGLRACEAACRWVRDH